MVTGTPQAPVAAGQHTGGDARALQSVIKSFNLIDELVEQGEATASDLAALVGEPRSSVYRMLATLQQIGLVEPGSRRGVYRPGFGLVKLCGAVLTRFDERHWRCRCSSDCVRKPRKRCTSVSAAASRRCSSNGSPESACTHSR